jgi:hypothetical protein
MQKKTKICVKHERECFIGEKLWKSTDAAPLLEQLDVAQAMLNLVIENKPPEDTRLV